MSPEPAREPRRPACRARHEVGSAAEAFGHPHGEHHPPRRDDPVRRALAEGRLHHQDHPEAQRCEHDQWADIVRWSLYAMLEGEELGSLLQFAVYGALDGCAAKSEEVAYYVRLARSYADQLSAATVRPCDQSASGERA